MSDLFKILYDKSIEEQMEHVNLMVFNGNTYHYNAKAVVIDGFIFLKTENGARLMYNKEALTMAM